MIQSTILPRAAPARVLACGAYLKNTACLIEGRQALWSAPHGDLVGAANREALADSVEELLRRASGPIQGVAHDLHPDIYSTQLAQSVADRLCVPAIPVQHHHAHIAVVHAEQAVGGPTIGLALDGMGFGEDGTAWGGEILWVDASSKAHQWYRLDHLVPLSLPGGDIAAREPWRMAAAVLHRLGRVDEIDTRFAPVVGIEAARVVRHLLERQINNPSTTSAGRWFDAAAGALGLSVHQSVEAEAAIALEREAQAWLEDNRAFAVQETSLDLASLVGELFDIADEGTSLARGAAIFHLRLANGLAHSVKATAKEHGIRTIVFGGGCFLNRILTGRLTKILQSAGLVVLQPRSVSCGDAGLALGQAWVAACELNMTPKRYSAAVATLCA